jgi:hypothetical protein
VRLSEKSVVGDFVPRPCMLRPELFMAALWQQLQVTVTQENAIVWLSEEILPLDFAPTALGIVILFVSRHTSPPCLVGSGCLSSTLAYYRGLQTFSSLQARLFRPTDFDPIGVEPPIGSSSMLKVSKHVAYQRPLFLAKSRSSQYGYISLIWHNLATAYKAYYCASPPY